ncbi:hypothetical protein K227x_31510 [Rubripirellula lacrimiformis]|uniref:Uncharacterized protein n=1 Tax=Rubripirellula lacrimiformis TaxID=1930273 RepID=A0A517NCC1_9BACT|nr:WYL domain-containing protein [Rubripirellula lacrimiformis]QDT04756.1 hypothetical protein K227x_31510 [Rubripirellula lacrimiformis]
MARNEQLIRQHKLLQLLEYSHFGRTLDELRGDLVLDLGLTNLHERTVRRDVEALQAAGFDIQNETVERGKVYKLGQNNKGVHEVGLSASEMIALSIGRELLYPLVGTQYWRGIETFWNKVQEAVPDGVFDHYSRYRKTLHVFGGPSKSYENHEGMLKTINRAIVEHRVVEVEYESVGKPASTRRIEPYGLAVYQSSIYVVAAAPEVTEPSERLRNWKLDRFRHATALDEYFKPDPSIELSKHLGKSIGIFSGEDPTMVQIRLGQRAAAYVREDPWHPEQKLESHEDGSTMMTIPASHPREVLPKVLSLGADAEVISPPIFREAVAEAVQKMAASYAASSV